MTNEKEQWEDDLEEVDWPYDENGEWIEDDLLESWDEIDDVDDYRHVDERDF